MRHYSMRHLFVALAALAACGPRGIAQGGDGTAPFSDPFTPKQSGSAYSTAWYSATLRDQTCTTGQLIRARNLIQATVDDAFPMFDTVSVWFYASEPSVLNETARADGNYELDNVEIAQPAALVHELLHHYEVTIRGLTMRETMKHTGWDTFNRLSDQWESDVTTYPCLAANPPGNNPVP